MEVDKPYLLTDFTLAELSSQLNVPTKTISMVVNSKLKSSFPELVNSYRIKFAIELLKDFKKKNLTIEAVAYESGFNNRTSFYNAFKKQTGKLPGDFIIDRAKKI
jgi:YesN/AraC family two-component response regulator